MKGIDKIAIRHKLDNEQISNLKLIYNECISYGCTIEQTAYILATVWHECKFRAVEEIGKGKNKPYGKKLKYKKIKGIHVSYIKPDKLYYGRGFVQLTWYELYDKFSKILGIDLLNFPEKALEPKIASEIIVKGMMQGLFTGAKLTRYINDKTKDSINARRVVNILDKAQLISNYYIYILSEIS
jgi:putative chitinase